MKEFTLMIRQLETSHNHVLYMNLLLASVYLTLVINFVHLQKYVTLPFQLQKYSQVYNQPSFYPTSTLSSVFFFFRMEYNSLQAISRIFSINILF